MMPPEPPPPPEPGAPAPPLPPRASSCPGDAMVMRVMLEMRIPPPPPPPPAPPPPPEPPPPAQLDAEAESHLNRLLAGVDDVRLRERLHSLGRAVLARPTVAKSAVDKSGRTGPDTA